MSREEFIFAKALELKTQSDRNAYLDEACGDDAALRLEIEGLLAAQQAAGSFLEQPAMGFDTAKIISTQDTVISDPNSPVFEPCETPDRIGKLGIYEIVELVGRGSMGSVYRAWDTKLHRIVAVKLMTAECGSTPDLTKRFLREARSAAAVIHANVVTIHAIDDELVPPLLAMEFVEGKTLDQIVVEQGPLAWEQVATIGQQMASGLAAAHAKGLIHRDIKPGNVLLEHESNCVKITDFGLARAVDHVGLTRTGTILGTPQYMSPEQATGKRIDHRSDLFSFGSVLYFLCTGQSAFPSKNVVGAINQVCHETPTAISERNPNIPDWLQLIVFRLLEKNPDDRYQSGEEVLTAIASKDPGESNITPPAEERNNPFGLRWLLWIAAGLAFVFVGLAIAEFAGLTNFFKH